MKARLVSFLVAASAWLSTSPVSANELLPLNLYFSDDRGEFFSTADPDAGALAIQDGYEFVRTSACVFRDRQPSNSVPLETYYGDRRRDHITFATSPSRQAAIAAGYRRLRQVGHISTRQGPGMVPMILYWNSIARDNFTVVTASEVGEAGANNYRRIRREGYVFPASACTGTPRAVTDSQYIIIIDKLTCDNRCSIGDVQLGVSLASGGSQSRKGTFFKVNEEADYPVNFGYRYNDDGAGVAVSVFFKDRGEESTILLRSENDEFVRLGGPQTRRFAALYRRDGRRSDFELSFRIFRASP